MTQAEAKTAQKTMGRGEVPTLNRFGELTHRLNTLGKGQKLVVVHAINPASVQGVVRKAAREAPSTVSFVIANVSRDGRFGLSLQTVPELHVYCAGIPEPFRKMRCHSALPSESMIKEAYTP